MEENPTASAAAPGVSQSSSDTATKPAGQIEVFTDVKMLVESVDAAAVKLVVLAGLPGCGKSTLQAQFIEDAPQVVGQQGWVRVCQDEEGSRKACERLVMECFKIKPGKDTFEHGLSKITEKIEKQQTLIRQLERVLNRTDIPAHARIQIEMKWGKARDYLADLQTEFLIQKTSTEANQKKHKIRNPVIIDRCNFDKRQRKTWINLAAKAQIPAAERICIVVGTPPEICAERATLRKGHKTLNNRIAFSIVHRVLRDFVLPSCAEGFSRILLLNTTGGPSLADYLLDGPPSVHRVHTHLPDERHISAHVDKGDGTMQVDPFVAELAFPGYTEPLLCGTANQRPVLANPTATNDRGQSGAQKSANAICYPGSSFFQMSYAGIFLTRQSREKLLGTKALKARLPNVILDHITLIHLQKKEVAKEHFTLPSPGTPIELEVYGILRSHKVETLLVRGSVFGKPLETITTSGLPHITLSLVPNVAAFESVSLIQKDINNVADGGSSEVTYLDTPIQIVGVSGVQVRAHDGGPGFRVFESRDKAAEILGVKWHKQAPCLDHFTSAVEGVCTFMPPSKDYAHLWKSIREFALQPDPAPYFEFRNPLTLQQRYHVIGMAHFFNLQYTVKAVAAPMAQAKDKDQTPEAHQLRIVRLVRLAAIGK